MKKKSIIVYSIFASIIYVLALSYFAFNLAYEYSNGASRTRRRFDHTKISIQESMTKINSESYDAKTIKNLITTSFGNMNDFAYIEFFEDGQTVYSYKTNTLTDGSSSKLLSNYSSTFRIDDKNYFFTANLYNLRPASIYLYGKRAFLVILIVTIITFVLIIITNLKALQSEENDEEEEIEEESDEENETPVEKPLSIFDEPEKTNTEAVEAVAAADEPVIIPEEKAVETEESEKTATDENEDKEDSVSEETTEEPILSDITDEEIETPSPLPEEVVYEEKQELPEGLYSPETGLSYEPFLETKLNNEINRSIASEADLSLFLIKINGIEKNSVLFKQICNYLIIQFQYKELLFEYKEESIAAIKINSTIDESITFADKIHSDIKNIINDENVDCLIGITSRTIRMVNADRLLIEAAEALEHAKEDKKCPIIAFRADAEKYRLANL